jgi:hypothetical protein
VLSVEVASREEMPILKESRQIEILIDHFSCLSRIRPKDEINMNYASSLSIFGLILTYLIVMLEFKMGDK